MADQINVSFAALQAGAASLSAKAKALTDTLDQLDQNLQPLKQTWYQTNSSAGEAAGQSEARLRAAVADIVNVIGQFSSKVSEAHDNQYALEQKNTGLFA